ncbi:MAG: tetratricopeptide repeat protein [Planctomycetota bacterium]|jgi:serine/threonine-protein kinase
MHDPDGHDPVAESPFERALRAGFLQEAERSDSVLARLAQVGGVRPSVLLHDAPDEDSPVLKVRPLDRAESAADDSRYQVAGEIARGGVGVIYKGRDRDLGRDVALKVLRREHARNPGILERFIEEAQIAGQLQHPGMVPVYGIGLQPDDRPYFTMKLVKGRTLAALLKERRDPGERRRHFLRLFEQICQTMAYAHSRGVIHRDLKPSNVMVGSFGEVLVVDWGFAKVLGRAEPARTEEERTVIATIRSTSHGSDSLAGSVMGTPAYMPPEQALGQVEELDERADVFSLGAILCRILTGAAPYVGPTNDQLVQAAQARLDDAFARLDACAADRELIDLAKRCLSPLPAGRPHDAGEVAQALADYLSAAEERAHQAEVQAVEQRARLRRERKHAVWERHAKTKTRYLAAALVLAVVLGGAAYAWSEADRRRHAAEARPQVEAAMEEAARLSAQARWAEAVAFARKARDLADAGGLEIGPAETLLDETERGKLAAEAAEEKKKTDAAFVAELEKIRLLRSEDFDPGLTDAAYVLAFRERRIDPTRPEEAAERIRDEYPAIVVDLAATLDEWAWMRRELVRDKDWRALRETARLADRDPWRTRLRDAARNADLDALRNLAAEALEQELPVRTLDLLGLFLEAAGDREAAVEFTRRVQLVHPGDFWVNWHLALYYQRRGKRPCDAAIRFATAALALRPSSGAHMSLGGFLVMAGRLDEAIAECRAALRLDPQSAEAHTNLGVAFFDKGMIDEAIVEYRKAIDLDPQLSEARASLGRALRHKGAFTEALQAFREALRLDPRPDYHNKLGALLSDKLGEQDAAIAEFRAAMQLDPENAAAHFNMGAALVTKGQLDDAIEFYREAARLDPRNGKSRDRLGFIFLRRGKVDSAIDEFRKAIELGNVRSYNNLGIALGRKGLRDEAEAAYRKAIALNPDAANAHNNLGDLLASKGLLDEAIECHREAIRANPEFAGAYYSLGQKLVRKGLPDEAIVAYRDAIRLNPKHAQAYNNLGNIWNGKGMTDKAIECLREAVRADPNLVQARCNLGLLLRHKTEYDAALVHLRRAHELGLRRPNWRHPTAKWVRECERWLALSNKLPAVLAGRETLGDAQEWLDAAHICRVREQNPEAARLYAKAFVLEPDTADDIRESGRHRHYAACSAVMAAVGQGGEKARSDWRAQALAWLRADLALRAAQAKGREFPGAVSAAEALEHWLDCDDLASVREETELAKLSEAERKQWRAFWREVAALLEEAG